MDDAGRAGRPDLPPSMDAGGPEANNQARFRMANTRREGPQSRPMGGMDAVKTLRPYRLTRFLES